MRFLCDCLFTFKVKLYGESSSGSMSSALDFHISVLSSHNGAGMGQSNSVAILILGILEPLKQLGILLFGDSFAAVCNRNPPHLFPRRLSLPWYRYAHRQWSGR